MKKRIFAVISAAVILIASVAYCFSAFAGDVDWYYVNETKTLYITGSGDMNNFSQAYEAPWSDYILVMENLVVKDGVTSLGDYAFSGATALKSVELSDTVTSIGRGAFSSTPLLLSLELSSNVAKIGDMSFAKIGENDKAGFVLSASPGSFALNYAIKYNINFDCDSVKCGRQQVVIKKNTAMRAYFPYVAKVDGTFNFYSVSKDDPIGYVYDSEFVQLASNDDYSDVVYSGMESCDFGLSVTLEKGKTYYFATNIYNPSLGTSFSVYIVPTSYTVTGDIREVVSKDGTLSNNTLASATINGEPTNGSYSINITEANSSAVFSYDGAEYEHAFTPDDGDRVNVSLVVCDRNFDGVVNGKDYADLKRKNSAYLQSFSSFANYKYNVDNCFTAE